jgi:hydroxymethylglutaryl-CoA reductase
MKATRERHFHELTPKERLDFIVKEYSLTPSEALALEGAGALTAEVSEHLIENVVGTFSLPLGVAYHFVIDGVPRLIPMAVEETSIIAAASATAKWISQAGEIRTSMRGEFIIGQIQLPRVSHPEEVRQKILLEKSRLIELGNQTIPGLLARGGGLKDLVVREFPRADQQGTMIVLHLLCDPCDAMGANIINQVCEALKPEVEALTQEKVGLCILSNLVDSKVARAEVVLREVSRDLGQGIQEASIFAESDPYRAATHNKGILNGIDPVLIATGNDWRAVEAGAHAFASQSGSYRPLSTWRYDEGLRELRGVIEVPMAVGVVGGVTRVHPTAQAALKLLRVETAEQLGRVAVAVGLVQNLGALKALATVGIVKGHMMLHASNLAIAAGAKVHEIPSVRSALGKILEREKKIHLSQAREILERIRAEASG